MSEPIISIRNVTKEFGGGVKAVDNVSIDIEQNEFFALLGNAMATISVFRPASSCGPARTPIPSPFQRRRLTPLRE